MFLGGWALMIAVGMLPGTFPVTRLVAVARGVPDALAWIGILALVVLVQKAAPLGERSTRVPALALATAAVVTWI
jgi:predicted metal-binding membrane protein